MLEQEFYSRLENSESGRNYLSLVNSCRSRDIRPERGFEIHHIQPVSLGGLDEKDNMVKLTVFEHCKAHALLAVALPCYKTLQPLVRMSSGQIRKLSDVEAVTLEECFRWSVLREKALHQPKSEEHRLKNRLSHIGLKPTPEQVRSRADKRAGTVTVTDGNITRYVLPSEVSEYEKRGWTRGISEKRRRRLQESHTGLVSPCLGRICIHKGEKELKVRESELQRYLDEGWSRGRKESFVGVYRRQMIGKTNAGKVRVNRDGVGKLVLKSDLQRYLDEGWKLGIARKTATYTR